MIGSHMLNTILWSKWIELKTWEVLTTSSIWVANFIKASEFLSFKSMVKFAPLVILKFPSRFCAAEKSYLKMFEISRMFHCYCGLSKLLWTWSTVAPRTVNIGRWVHTLPHQIKKVLEGWWVFSCHCFDQLLYFLSEELHKAYYLQCWRSVVTNRKLSRINKWGCSRTRM